MTIYTFERSLGRFLADGEIICDIAYSGHGAGVNNVSMEAIHNVGPLPAGVYDIGVPKSPVDILGPYAMPLTAHAGVELFGRGSFFIHGDNNLMNHTASDGCIILPHGVRVAIAGNPVKVLRVI